MHSTKLAMGRGSISTSHGQIRILKHSTPDLLTYIQKAVQTGVYRSSEEIEEMNQRLSENPSDLRRIRWNVQRGSKIQDYPKEYEILSLNPPRPFKPRIPVKDQKKIYNQYIQEKRPTDRLAQQYLNRRSTTHQEPMTSDDYYKRLLGAKPSNGGGAMGAKSARLAKAYAVAVKQYELMRKDNLTEKEAMEEVDRLLAQEDSKEGSSSRATAEALKHHRDPLERGLAAFPNASLEPNKEISLLYSEDQRALEGMIRWTKRLQAVPYSKWTVGASVALDHWIAKRVLGLSEETWLALLEGDSPQLMGRGRDIIMARQALFPETILEGLEPEESTPQEDDLDALLATLEGFNASKTEPSSNEPTNEDSQEQLTQELQAWRRQHSEKTYDTWSAEKKQEFMSWLEGFVASQVPESSLANVDLEETRKNILETPPHERDEAQTFWKSLQDETSAEIFLQALLKKETNKDHPFFQLDYPTQIKRLVHLGSIQEIANEYATDSQRSKFLTRYGDYLLEGIQFEHLVPDAHGPIQGSDLGKDLQDKYDIQPTDRFRISQKPPSMDDDDVAKSRMLFVAWNQFKAGRAHYEEKLFQKGLLGLSYDKKKK